MPRYDPGVVAEFRIEQLGIAAPEDIDIEALAYDAGLEVRYEDLSGCAATLTGFGSRGIATIRPSGTPERDRFSIAHELGHWDLHRGRSFVCRLDDAADSLADGKQTEREADDYAAHLLMPGRLFRPLVKDLKKPGFDELRDLAQLFQASLLATSLRLVGVDTEPAFLINYDTQGNRRWYKRAPCVPAYWVPGKRLDDDAYTADVLGGKPAPPRPRKQPAELWFGNVRGEPELLEHCLPYHSGALTLLYITDEDMLG